MYRLKLTSLKDQVILITVSLFLTSLNSCLAIYFLHSAWPIKGASSGFGEAIAHQCASEGARLVLISRRQERLDKVKGDILANHPDAKIHLVAMDVRDTDRVSNLPHELPEEFNDVSILINNAGLALGTNHIQDNILDDIKTMLDTNVLAVAAFTKVFSKGMIARNAGHIVNIGSTAGWESYPGGSGYCASKHALRAYTSAAREELVSSNIRVSLISPGAAETEFSIVRFKGDEGKASAVYSGFDPLVAADIADHVLFVITRPPHVQVNDIVVTSVHQAGAKTLARPKAS